MKYFVIENLIHGFKDNKNLWHFIRITFLYGISIEFVTIDLYGSKGGVCYRVSHP